MMGEVSSMALAFHVSSSVKYAYFANYETDIAEKTKWNNFLPLCEILALQP